MGAHEGDVNKVKQCILNGSDPNIRDANNGGVRPLILASLQGNLPVMEVLLKAGADPNATDDRGGCPLLLAAGGGLKDAMEVLIQNGADVNVRDPKGATCLHTAAFFGDASVVEMLVRNRADPEVVDEAGKTALLLAAQNLKGIPPPPEPAEGQQQPPPPPPDMKDVPEHMRPPPDMPPPPGHPDFDEAKFVAWIQEQEKKHGKGGKGKGDEGKGGKGDEGKGGKGKGGKPPEPEYARVVDILVANGAKAQVSDTQGMSPLMLACDLGEAHVAAMLIRGGARVEHRDQ